MHVQAFRRDRAVDHTHDESGRSPQAERLGSNLDIQHGGFSLMLMALWFSLTR